MVIISAVHEELAVINLRVDGQLVLSSPSDRDVIVRLEELGLHDPARLVAGCRRWGTVEIHSAAQDRRRAQRTQPRH